MTARVLAFGVVFGFILSRAGATDPAAITGMFLLTDLHLVGVIGVAVAMNAVGFRFLRRRAGGPPSALATKPMVRGLPLGALLFGVGWALSGTCPGTALAQIGEGRLAGLLTFGGILLGAWLHGRRRVVAPTHSVASPGVAST
jgi:uncharacterized protein